MKNMMMSLLCVLVASTAWSQERLDLSHTNVTDEGLKPFLEFTHLKEISLEHTRITDAGLENLWGLTQLEVLRLGNETYVTEAGIQRLRVALPNCSIVHGYNVEID